MGHYVYWQQFEGLREDLMKKQSSLHAYFSSAVTTVDLGYADDIDSAYLALKQAQREDLDALFIVMSTYVTSQVVFPFARYLHIPQVLVSIQPLDRLDYAHTTTRMQLENDDICSLPEFTGVYARLGAPKPFLLAAAASETQKIACRIGELERAVCAAAAFKYAKFGYLGHTYDGMYDMNTDPTAFSAAFGAHVSMIEFGELMKHVKDAKRESVQQKMDEIRSVFRICQPSNDPLTDVVEEEDLSLASRCAVGLDSLVEDRGLSALAYFYRGMPGTEEEQIAANLIIGNSLLTSHGIPLAGEADLKTAAAMLIMNRIGGGGSFAEIHPFDIEEDIVLVGHDGPHNTAIAEGKPRLRKRKK
jgi:L-arabinose isomerase